MPKKSCREAMAETLLSLIKENPNIIVVTSDARGSAKIEKIASECPDNFIDTGIAEQNEIGVAAGLALCGKIPFVCAPAIFLSARALDQIRVDISYNNTNVKICGVSSGFAYGTQGPSHLAVYDLAAIRPMENITVLSPSDAIETSWMIKECVKLSGPVYLRMGRANIENVYSQDDVANFKIGKANMLCDGNDLCIITCGEELSHAIKAVEILKQKNISVRLLDMHTIKPIDKDAIIKAAKDTKAILTVEQHSIYGGLGSAVSEVLSQNMPARLQILGLPDEHCITGSEPEIVAHYGLDADGIARSVGELLSSLNS